MTDKPEPEEGMLKCPPGRVFLDADYAELELRIYASMAAALKIPEEYLRPPKQVDVTLTRESAEIDIRPSAYAKFKAVFDETRRFQSLAYIGIDIGIGESYSSPQADDEPFPPDL